MTSPPTDPLLALRRLSLPLLGVLLYFGTLEAQAHLGENPRQCIRRYGAPVGETHVPGLIPNGLAFHRGEYSITCGFEDDRCVIVVILRMAPQDPRLQPIPRDDMTLFMTDNFGHTSWDYTRLDGRGYFWTMHDPRRQRTFHASYAPSLEMLTLRME